MAILAAHVKLLQTYALGLCTSPSSKFRTVETPVLGPSAVAGVWYCPHGDWGRSADPVLTRHSCIKAKYAVQWCGMQRTSWSATITSGNGQGARQAYKGVRLPCRGACLGGVSYRRPG